MEPTAADIPGETRGSSDVAVADLPSTSGAHWANRDNDAEFHRPGGQPTPFRRPPAMSGPGQDAPVSPPPSGPPDTATWDAFAPSGSSGFEAAWDAFGAATAPADAAATHGPAGAEPAIADPRHWTGRDVLPVPEAETQRRPPAPPEFGPAPPAAPGRTSFGVTDGPIGGSRNADGPIGGFRSADGAFGGFRSADGAFGGFVGADGPDRAEAGSTVPEPAAPRDVTHTGELLLGPGREIRPHRAARRDPGTLPPVTQPPPMRGTPAPAAEPRRSRTMVIATAVLAMVVLLGGAVVGFSFFSGRDSSLTSILTAGAARAGTRSVSAPIGGRTEASFELTAATTQLRMRAADLGDDLYRVTTADDSGSAPRPVLTGDRVQLQLTPEGDGASGIVEVLLSSRVTWALRFVGGADEQIVNLAGGQVSSIDVLGGSRRVELALPLPTGTVPVRFAGALDELAVTSPQGAPVRVQVDGGAKTVSAGARTLRDVKPGSTLTPRNWQVPNRYDVDAASRITLLSVENIGT